MFTEVVQVVTVDMYPIACVGVLMVIDCISGFGKGVATGTVNSKVMREGALHKATYIVLIALFVIVESAQQHFDIWADFPTTLTLCIYLCVTEIVSIIENLCEINPSMKEWSIIKFILSQKKDK